MVVSSPFMPRRWARAIASAALHFRSASGRSRAFSHSPFAFSGKTITTGGTGRSGDWYIGVSMTSSKSPRQGERQADKETRRQGDSQTARERIGLVCMVAVLLDLAFSGAATVRERQHGRVGGRERYG